MRAWLAFMRAHLAMSRAMERDSEAQGRLAVSEHSLLATLDGGPAEGMRPTELAEIFALTKSGLTRALDRLEAEHLIERRTCPSDGRGWLVGITALGRRALKRAAPGHFRAIAKYFADHLTDRDVNALADALERVAAGAGRGT